MSGISKQRRRLLEGLYVWTIGLLVVHQMDSAFWQEWNLFGMSGGIEGFVASNVLLVIPFLYGLVSLVRAPRAGARWGIVLSALGVAALGIHSWFFVQGRPEFRNAASVTVLVGAFVASLGLAWQSVKVLREPVIE